MSSTSLRVIDLRIARQWTAPNVCGDGGRQRLPAVVVVAVEAFDGDGAVLVGGEDELHFFSLAHDLPQRLLLAADVHFRRLDDVVSDYSGDERAAESFVEYGVLDFELANRSA
jgi:hypothetical protein